MQHRVLLRIVGGLLVVLAAILCVPALFSVFSMGAHTMQFVAIAAACCFAGIALWQSNPVKEELSHRTGFAVVGCSWAIACLVGALPYYLSGSLTSFLDAFFESTSGFSGTGASVIPDVEKLDRALLLWRSITQWLGGMGIIVFFIAILPVLGLGGGQLFKAEVTGPSKDKITPRVRETAKKLWLLYLSFTIVLAICLRLAGMNGFDAVNHALTTISTGGFSTRAAGIAAFESALIEYIIAFFMLISAVNFALHYRLIALRDFSAFFATEWKWYSGILLGATALVTFSIWHSNYADFETAFREGLFTVVCTASSTGFTNANYLLWPQSTHYILILLMVMGGMSGSTAGGMKCIRIVAALKQLAKEMKQIVHPSAMFTIRTDHHSVPSNIINAIWGFIFLYFTVFATLTGILVFQDLDLVSASTATLSALSNIGPAFGSLGPYDNYSELNELAKVSLCFGMLFGRLEFYTLLILFTPAFWKK